MRALPGRHRRAATWRKLAADAAALPPAPALDRSVSIVVARPEAGETLSQLPPEVAAAVQASVPPPELETAIVWDGGFAAPCWTLGARVP